MIIDFENDKKGGGSCDLQEVAVTYTTNGINEILPDQGKDGISKAVVTVEVPEPYLVPLDVVDNGIYNPKEGEDGFSSVNVHLPAPELEIKSLDITANGDYALKPGADYEGIAEVSLKVEVPAPEVKLETLTATANGSYTPTAPNVGYSKVDVNVPQTGGPDFTGTGYTASDQAFVNSKIQADLDYTEQTAANWNPTSTSIYFSSDKKLVYFPAVDTSSVTDMYNAFYYCTSLVKLPDVMDTSSVTNMSRAFYYCTSLVKLPDVMDTSSVTNMSQAFYKCTSLVKLPDVMDTSSVTNMSQAFNDCSSLVKLPELNCGKVTDISYLFGWSNLLKLTELGGFIDLKIDFTGDGSLKMLPNLTKQSILNVLNGLYDFRGNGDASTTKTISFSRSCTAFTGLTEEEKAIATNKGWILKTE